MPKVTVLMSVYNGEKYLREAIDSILGQTFKDFEFLIIDDGSTDSSAKIIRSYSDPRIRLIQNEENIGLTRSLNKGLKLAKGQYIARQDADDISLPERLRKQVSLLDEHPAIGLVSSSITKVNETGKEIGSWKLPSSNDVIKRNLLKGLNQFSHPSSMFRKKCVERVGGYRETFKMAQDYDLWLRIAEEFGVANIEESLCKYRIVHDGVSASKRSQQKSYHQFGYSCAIQRQIFGVDELGYEPPGELFRSLRRELSRGGIARRRMLSDKYFMCARRCAFKNGRRDLRMSVKYFLKSLIYNPLNLTAWRYATYRFVDKAKNRF